MARDIAYTIAEQAFLQGYMKTANPYEQATAEVARIRAQHADIRKTRALVASEERALNSAKSAQIRAAKAARRDAKAARRGDSVQATQAIFDSRPTDPSAEGYVPGMRLASDEPNRTSPAPFVDRPRYSTNPFKEPISYGKVSPIQYPSVFPPLKAPTSAGAQPSNTFSTMLVANFNKMLASGPSSSHISLDEMQSELDDISARYAPPSNTQHAQPNQGAPTRADQATRIPPAAPIAPTSTPPTPGRPTPTSPAQPRLSQPTKLRRDQNTMLKDYAARTDRTPEGDARAQNRLATMYEQAGDNRGRAETRARNIFRSRFSRR